MPLCGPHVPEPCRLIVFPTFDRGVCGAGVLADLRIRTYTGQRDVNCGDTFGFLPRRRGPGIITVSNLRPLPRIPSYHWGRGALCNLRQLPPEPRGKGGGSQSTIGAQNLRRPRGAWGAMRNRSRQSKQNETLKKSFPSMLAAWSRRHVHPAIG